MTNEELLNLLRRGEERMKRFTDAFTLQQRPEWNDVELANRWRDQVNQLLRASPTKECNHMARVTEPHKGLCIYCGVSLNGRGE